jgi:hypothetical protein
MALLRIGLVAGQAAQGDHLRVYPFEGEDLRLIAASLNVRRPGTMARLAAMNLLAPDLGQAGSVVRTRIDALELFLMAALASVGTDKLRALGWLGKVLCLRLLCRWALRPGRENAAAKDHPGECQKPWKVLFSQAVKKGYIRYRV